MADSDYSNAQWWANVDEKGNILDPNRAVDWNAVEEWIGDDADKRTQVQRAIGEAGNILKPYTGGFTLDTGKRAQQKAWLDRLGQYSSGFESYLPVSTPTLGETVGEATEAQAQSFEAMMKLMKENYPDYFAGREQMYNKLFGSGAQDYSQGLYGFTDQLRESQAARGMSMGPQSGFQEALGRTGYLDQMRQQEIGNQMGFLGMGNPYAAQDYSGMAAQFGMMPYQQSMDAQNYQMQLASMYQGNQSSPWETIFGIGSLGLGLGQLNLGYQQLAQYKAKR